MANPEHLALLKSGRDAFNAWRDEHPHVRIDLSGADLSKMNLAYYDLDYAKLRGANLIVGAQDVRGYQSLLTYDRDSGKIDIQFGCQCWDSFDEVRAHFGPGYDSDGDPDECLLIIDQLEARYKLRMKQEAGK